MTANSESPELPNYLLVGKGRYYKAPEQAKPEPKHGKKLYPTLNFGVSGDAPPNFINKDSFINYSKALYDPYQDFGLKKSEGEGKIRDSKELSKHLQNNVSLMQTFSIDK
jgi:hypothetical protein